MKELKQKIRKEILNKRDIMTVDERAEKSEAIFKRLKELPQFSCARTVMCFVSFGSEVITTDFLRLCLETGKKLGVPKIIKNSGGTKEMVAVRIQSLEADLEPGAFGIPEPKSDCRQFIDPEGIDLIIVPGLAFDLQKQRIGYGGGFYDRYLRKTGENCCKAGVAFETQISVKLPVEGHDLPVDIVVTEERIL